mgnify:CR=1 FL=1
MDRERKGDIVTVREREGVRVGTREGRKETLNGGREKETQ